MRTVIFKSRVVEGGFLDDDAAGTVDTYSGGDKKVKNVTGLDHLTFEQGN